jgi:hypothetical protein
MIDLFIEFVALVAHGDPLEPRTEATLIGCLMVSTAGMGICSPASTREPKGTTAKGTTLFYFQRDGKGPAPASRNPTSHPLAAPAQPSIRKPGRQGTAIWSKGRRCAFGKSRRHQRNACARSSRPKGVSWHRLTPGKETAPALGELEAVRELPDTVPGEVFNCDRDR